MHRCTPCRRSAGGERSPAPRSGLPAGSQPVACRAAGRGRGSGILLRGWQRRLPSLAVCCQPPASQHPLLLPSKQAVRAL